MNKTKILFLCTGNTCRSQMAEGWTRHLKGDVIEPHSAGLEPGEVDPLAIKVMAEAGVDISGQRSKDMEEMMEVEFDYVVTLCDHASENCPFFPGSAKIVHKGFDDPPKLAQTSSNEEEALRHYRRVRDEIKSFVTDMPDNLKGE